jgi:hypothetical protein
MPHKLCGSPAAHDQRVLLECEDNIVIVWRALRRDHRIYELVMHSGLECWHGKVVPGCDGFEQDVFAEIGAGRETTGVEPVNEDVEDGNVGVDIEGDGVHEGALEVGR